MLSKTGLHAVMALTALSELPKGQYAGANAIAKKIGAPANYLGKLLQTLARERLVISQKGLGGGFRLAKPPDEITLYDVVCPIEGTERWEGCGLGRSECSNEFPCAIHSQWEKVRDAYLNLLKETKIGSLADFGEIEKRMSPPSPLGD